MGAANYQGVSRKPTLFWPPIIVILILILVIAALDGQK